MIGSRNRSHFQSRRGGLRPGTRCVRCKAEVLVMLIILAIPALFYTVVFANFNLLSESSARKDLHSDSVGRVLARDHVETPKKALRTEHDKGGNENGDLDPKHNVDAPVPTAVCEISSIANMDPEERNPVKGKRHMVQPPAGPITLVCCGTTAGPLQIAVHSTWAPNGAERFISMVNSGYFSSKVALMRCVKNFICQFGIAGKPMLNRPFSKNLVDDPNWLPEGPKHRVNESGVKRFAKGYLAYAGSGKNSRGNQLIVALENNGPLAGGSPWEVPFGEIVGHTSFRTLDNIYTGYGEKGPSQPLLRKEGSTPSIAKEFPLLDYITSCHVVDDERDALVKD